MIGRELWYREAFGEQEIRRLIRDLEDSPSEEGLLELLRQVQRTGQFEDEAEWLMREWGMDEVRGLLPPDMTFEVAPTPGSGHPFRDAYNFRVTYRHPEGELSTTFILRPAVGLSSRQGKLLFWFIVHSGSSNRRLLSMEKAYSLPDFVRRMVSDLRKAPRYRGYFHEMGGME